MLAYFIPNLTALFAFTFGSFNQSRDLFCCWCKKLHKIICCGLELLCVRTLEQMWTITVENGYDPPPSDSLKIAFRALERSKRGTFNF